MAEIKKGKFDKRPDMRGISRWLYELREDMSFYDPILGIQQVTSGFISDLASIRALREVAKYAAIFAILVGLYAQYSTLIPDWLSYCGWVLVALTMLLYDVLAGYGERASILHDYLYKEQKYPRQQCDDIFYRALRGEGIARWRAMIFYVGVRLFAWYAYRKYRR